jgi:chromosome segregation ATPase
MFVDRVRAQSPQSPEFQSPRSDKSTPRKASALTELRKVAEQSVSRARELELACRELAERDRLVAELQERLDAVRNEYRGEVLQLRSELSTVKEHLEETRQDKSIMEEEFLQELARLEAERAELVGAKHFLEEQVGIVEKDAAMATAQHLEATDQCKRLEAQVRSLEAKLRTMSDIADQGRAQLTKTATSAEAKDAIIMELRDKVKDLQKREKRADSERKRLDVRLHHEAGERDQFAKSIDGILNEFGISRDRTPTRARATEPRTNLPG